MTSSWQTNLLPAVDDVNQLFPTDRQMWAAPSVRVYRLDLVTRCRCCRAGGEACTSFWFGGTNELGASAWLVASAAETFYVGISRVGGSHRKARGSRTSAPRGSEFPEPCLFQASCAVRALVADIDSPSELGHGRGGVCLYHFPRSRRPEMLRFACAHAVQSPDHRRISPCRRTAAISPPRRRLCRRNTR